MKIKSSADIRGLHIKMRPVLIAADSIWKHLGRELVVTSGLDSEHSAGSLHYYGGAVDLRTKYFTGEQAKDAAELLRGALHDGYTVVNEGTHIHAQYDGLKEQ